jgi:hypothetical protein
MNKFMLLFAIALAIPIETAHADNYTYIQGSTLIESLSTTVTSGGTLSLSSTSNTNQQLTGTSSHTVVLPNATGLKNGRRFRITNRSTQSISIQYFGGAALRTMPTDSQAEFIVVSNGTSAGTWDSDQPISLTTPIGAILFGNSTSTGVTYDSSNLYWDDTNNRLGIGNSSPSVTLHVTGAARITGLSTAGPVITDSSGNLSSEAQLAASRGGTGQNMSASTGVVKVASGTFSASTITDSDVSAAAAITRSKLASGTINHVLINDGSGVVSSEAQLSISRGGTGVGSTPTNGQLLIGNGSGFSLASITGTSNQITVTGGSGTITLATPQDIATGSSPTFTGLTLSGSLSTQRRDENGSATVNALATSTTYVKLTSGGTPVTTVNGAVAGSNGQQLIINNNTGGSVTISHLSGSASSANQFSLPDSANATITSGSSATFIYDTGASKWVQAGGGGSGSSTETVSGTRASPNNVVSGTGITGITTNTVVFVQGSGGHVTVSASPQIDGCSGGTTVGRRVTVIGRNDSQVVILSNGLGLELNGPWTGGASDVLSLLCDGTSWIEVSRNN